MISRLYSILDRKAKFFSPTFEARTDVEAQRAYDRLKSDPNSDLAKYPDDFALYYLGTVDRSTGILAQQAELPFEVILIA